MTTPEQPDVPLPLDQLDSHEDTATNPAMLVQDYTQVVADLNQSPENATEEQILTAFRLRDDIQAYLQQLTPEQLQALANADEHLYTGVKASSVNIEKWRYLFAGDDLHWWWYIDQSPVLRDGEIVYEEGVVTWQIGLAIILFMIGGFIMLLTTQRLWVNGLDALGTLNLVGQLLIGGGLITDRGRELSMDLAHNVAAVFLWALSRVKGPGTPDADAFPLARQQQRQHGRGLLYAAGIFALVAMLIILSLPALSRLLHNRGVDALQDNDLNTARFYLETAVVLQPDIPLPLISKPDTATSLVQLGDLYLELGDIDSARNSYRRAIDEDPRIVLAHHRLGRIYIDDGELAQAIPLLDQGIVLLEDYIAGDTSLPLAVGQAKQELFLAYVTRAYGYISAGEYRIALSDLNSAEAIINEDLNDNEAGAVLFINAENKDRPPPGSIRPTEMHVLFLQYYRQSYERSCNERAKERGEERQDLIQRIGINDEQSMQQRWLEAAERPFVCHQDHSPSS